jgi:alpha-ketoglutaric semialdehyde dehydrogenase
MGAGQFCTNPGLVVMLDGPEADIFGATATDALHEISAQTMLTDGIANAYRDGVKTIGQATGVDTLVASDSSPREATPFFARTTAATLLEKPVLALEVFGPAGLVVRAANMDEMRSIAASLEGQLTCTLQIDAVDTQDARTLIPILERKAGRLLANGFPTGVEVANAMVHGGPFPASTNFGATSVGTMAIRRFLRPVCYQDLPEALLPLDLV